SWQGKRTARQIVLPSPSGGNDSRRRSARSVSYHGGTMRELRRALTVVGELSVGLVAASLAMTAFALFNGIHCPECDERLLGAAYAWWARYFQVKTGVL